ncbi:MAG: hypothetical protein EBZ05_05155 [Verrucomicrobia bacterium]|nr:hypothetical protein [Verrucomicrobiota bacterium]
MKIATIITIVLIAILFFFSYGEFSRPMLALLALLMSIVVCLGLTTAFIGHLNIISQAFIVMILGLGIDFGIQFLGRYEEETSFGRSPAEAVENTMATTGKALLTGGGTTAAAFYAMCFNDFTGLTELGWIAGTGVLLALAASLSILPALLLWRDRKGTVRVGEIWIWGGLGSQADLPPLPGAGRGGFVQRFGLAGIQASHFRLQLAPPPESENGVGAVDARAP